MVWVSVKRRRDWIKQLRVQTQIENENVFGPAGLFVQVQATQSKYAASKLNFYRSARRPAPTPDANSMPTPVAPPVYAQL